MAENFYWAASCGAILIAALYCNVWPKPINAAHAQLRPLLLHWVLRWGHCLVWVLLALFFMGKTGRLGFLQAFWPPVGLAAFGAYGIFLAACLYDRNRFQNK